MHWLPLVAMVIASALLFLQCPLPRLVTLTMETGSNIQSSSSAANNFNNSHGDFNSSANETERAPHRTADNYSLEDNTLSSFTNVESLANREQSQETLLAERDLDKSKTADQTDFRSQGSKSHEHKTLEDSRVLTSNKPQSVRFQEDGSFEGVGTGTRGRKTLLKDRDNDRTRSKKNLLKDRDSDRSQGKKTLQHERDSDESQGKKALPKDRNNNGTMTQGKEHLIKDKDSDMSPSTRTLLKDQDNQENSIVNQQLPDSQPVEAAGVEGVDIDLASAEGLEMSIDDILQEDEELLLLASQPRVLFSTSTTPPKHPPLQLLMESGLLPREEENEEEYEEQSSADIDRTLQEETAKPGQARDGESYRNLLLGLSDTDSPSPVLPPRLSRKRRQAGLEGRERAACESVSMWVTDKKTAMDFRRRNVTVVEFFETKKGNKIVQHFYETRCRGSKGGREPTGEHGMAGGDCLGVDKKHWLSECRTKQGYVRAFTSDSNGRLSWNWIRIDSSCVCVLKSKNHRNQWQGRGTR
ncbi:uncharacterized protein LOC103042028 [Astyanax mexicanus]|uniref:uncharacterized protein LOC103042028 n=1 Tax=Astyanax mexicanus TaxID=7994 RepID=UPI0020CB30B7|nr:uncharacterized protein LOC103042028 [Astyanax mexicanus]XP_015458420.3 uncharacterized protein LOC103042028 [Astyanax mexicanus]